MNPFSESDLAQLRDRFPDRDVDRVAADCATKHARKPFHNPLAMLAKWLETAEKNNTNRLGEVVDDAPPPGMFRADGSWDQRGHGNPAMHRFIDMLVTARRRDYSLARIAERIMRESSWWIAFPNAATWATADSWHTAPSSTSAERCVIDFGRVPVQESDLPRSDATYAAFRFGLLKRVLDSPMTQSEIADVLEAHAPKFASIPGLSELLDHEIAVRRGFGVQEAW